VVRPSRPQDGIFLLLLHGWPGFARTSDLFLMDRLDLDSWEANKR
jgi:hypothetical protein